MTISILYSPEIKMGGEFRVHLIGVRCASSLSQQSQRVSFLKSTVLQDDTNPFSTVDVRTFAIGKHEMFYATRRLFSAYIANCLYLVESMMPLPPSQSISFYRIISSNSAFAGIEKQPSFHISFSFVQSSHFRLNCSKDEWCPIPRSKVKF